jgi:hypothetical protein
MAWNKTSNSQHEFVNIIKTRMEAYEERDFILPHKIAMIYIEIPDEAFMNIGGYYFVQPQSNSLYYHGNFDVVAIKWSNELDRHAIDGNKCTLVLQSADPMNVKIIFVCFPDWSEYEAVLE